MEDLKTMFATILIGAVLSTVGSAFSSVTGAMVDRKEAKEIQKQGVGNFNVLSHTLVLTDEEAVALLSMKEWQKGRARGDALKRHGGLEGMK